MINQSDNFLAGEGIFHSATTPRMALRLTYPPVKGFMKIFPQIKRWLEHEADHLLSPSVKTWNTWICMPSWYGSWEQWNFNFHICINLQSSIF